MNRFETKIYNFDLEVKTDSFERRLYLSHEDFDWIVEIKQDSQVPDFFNDPATISINYIVDQPIESIKKLVEALSIVQDIVLSVENYI